jgi:O-antigen/teichoic acid export membrane protein
MSFVRQGVGTLSSRAIVFAAAFLANILIARFLGPAGKGQISLVIFTITILINVAALGIPSALVFHVGQKLHNTRRLFGAALVLYSSAVIVFAAFYLAVLPYLQGTIFSDLPPWLMYFVLLAFPLSLAIRYAQHIILGLRRVFHYNLVTVLDRVAYVVLLLVILWGFERSVAGIVYAEVLGRLTAFVVAVCLLLGALKPLFSFGRKELGALLGYGLRAHLMLVIALISYRIGLYVLRYFYDAAVVGQYSIALNMAEVLLFIPNSFGIILFTRTSSSTNEEASRFTPIAARNVLALTLVSALVLGLVAPVLVPLIFGQAFRPSIPLFLVLLPGVVTFALYRVLSYDMIGRGFPLRVSLASGAGLIANLGVAILLVPSLGAMGAVFGNLAGYALTTVIITYIFLRMTGNRLSDLILWRRDDFRHYRNLLAKLRNGGSNVDGE